MKNLNNWSGKLIDASGQTGTIELSGEGPQLERGRWRLVLGGRDAPAGEIGGTYAATPEGDALRFKYSPSAPDRTKAQAPQLEWSSLLRRAAAGSYAAAALLGEYHVTGSGETTLGHGVLVLWQFT